MVDRSENVVVGNSRGFYFLLLFGSLAFVAAGIFLVVQDPSELAGWGALTFFGGCAAVAVWQIVDSRPRLTIDDRGILDRTLGVGVIPWGEIQGAFVRSISGNDFICLEVREPEQFVSRMGSVRRAMLAANRKLGFTDLSVNLSGLPVRTEEVFELIMKRAEAAQG